LSFCEPDFRIQDLLEIGHSQLFSSNFDFNFFTHNAAQLFVRFECRLRGYTRLMKRVFFLSPAHAGGKRAAMLINARGTFELARQVQIGAASLGDVFSFCSGLYFRGKLAYARHFAEPPEGIPGVQIITPSRGVVDAETLIGTSDLSEFAEVPVDIHEPRFTYPLKQSIQSMPGIDSSEIILLGSVATGKYADTLLPILGERLLFPAEFAGRGDMSRGALLLRCVATNTELSYSPLSGVRRSAAVRRLRRLHRQPIPPEPATQANPCRLFRD
jgi:hypothetical protein